MSRKEELNRFKAGAKAIVARELTKIEDESIEVAYDAGITNIDDAIDFMYLVLDLGHDNPSEIISDYMDIL